MKKITIGDVEIVALTDGAGLVQPLDHTFPTVRAEQWGPYYQRYPRVFADSSRWYLQYDYYVVRTPEQIVMVDTGSGEARIWGWSMATC